MGFMGKSSIQHQVKPAVLTGRAFCSDRAELHAHRMMALFEMGQAMPVAANTTKLRATAAKVAASETKPEILLQLTLPAVCKPLFITSDSAPHFIT